MNRNIDYIIDEDSAGLRVEQFLRRKRYSGQNLSEIKRMPKSILVNGVHYYMRQELSTGDHLQVRICETQNSEKIPPTKLPLDIIYEDEDLLVLNKPDGMPIHPSLNNYTNSMGKCSGLLFQSRESLSFSGVATVWTGILRDLPLCPSIWSVAVFSRT